ncbi:hypothetical protein WIS52_26165 [Pseudonocardia nematodicida]|uniref:Uncharacterized protein n=1 Tax=Pseudonocardia nematodicida TaxID=1206997 RepID=A0ABV1KHQ5_9PSEU
MPRARRSLGGHGVSGGAERVVRAVGVVLASAAAVVGLGLLAENAALANATPDGAGVPVVAVR